MKKSMLFLMVLLGSTVILSSCHKDNRKNEFIRSNEEFVTQATSSNMFEIAAANQALTKGASDSVKMFATMMITDHQQTAAQMMALNNQKGWPMPTTLAPKEQANLNTLSSLSGSAFDKQYATMMVMSHQETIALFNNAAGDNKTPYADGVQDPDLRAFAAGKLPVLNMHLAMAQRLQGVVNMEP